MPVRNPHFDNAFPNIEARAPVVEITGARYSAFL
jgi:hypothetical protein